MRCLKLIGRLLWLGAVFVAGESHGCPFSQAVEAHRVQTSPQVAVVSFLAEPDSIALKAECGDSEWDVQDGSLDSDAPPADYPLLIPPGSAVNVHAGAGSCGNFGFLLAALHRGQGPPACV